MKVVVAIDSFKESLSSLQAGQAAKTGILEVCKDAKVIVLPLADGGEGTVDTLVSGLGGDYVNLSVTGPLGDLINAKYGVIPEKSLAVIEMAQAAGLALVPLSKRNPMDTTTFGVGEMILDAINRGYMDFIIGIGGSATNDAGLGMLSALGYGFYDARGEALGCFGRDVEKIVSISAVGADRRLAQCRFRIACDVTNPLYGKDGASHVFGPQKGADAYTVERLDKALLRFSQLVENHSGADFAHAAGAGAAGGLGYAFLAFLNAQLASGISIVLDATGFEEEAKDADFVITGEGKLDFQTSMGKAPIGVAGIAKKYGAVVLAFSGCATQEAEECNYHGIDAYFPIISAPMSAFEAMQTETAQRNMESTVKQVFRLICALGYK